jgi:adenosyl cobinamide kinase/adenosyl cobinamide phosphate guanylyltransferase
MPRSVCIHPDHRSTVAAALQQNGFLTQGALAAHLEIALSTVNNFFRGLNVSVAKFEQISEVLGLDPRLIIQPKQGQRLGLANGDAIANEFFAYDGAWVGRESLIADLTQQLQGAARLLFITGIAGVGKTALAERLILDLQDTWTVMRENFDNQAPSADFGGFAIRLLEKGDQVVVPDERKDMQQLLLRLVQQLQTQRHLIVVDSLEELLQGNDQEGWSEFKDAGFLQFFQQVLVAASFASRIIVTSQELPIQVVEFGTRYQNFWINQTLSGLSDSEQLELFAKTGLEVTPAAIGRPYLVRIGKAYEGHPLALRVIAGEIGSRPFFGNVVGYWQQYGTEIEVVEQAIAEAQAGDTVGAKDPWKLDRFTRSLRRNVRKRLEQTFARLQHDSRYAYILLCETAVYRCPVPEDWWLSHLNYWECDQETQLAAIDTLRDRFLVEAVLDRNQYLLRQHHLIRSLALDHLQRLE